MSIANQNVAKLIEMKNLLSKLPKSMYIKPKNILSGSSIGQHFRHIVEFYLCLEKGIGQNKVCYDDRKRDFLLESNITYTLNILDYLITLFTKSIEDKALILMANHDTDENEYSEIHTSLYREMTYALDHTIHHLAIIKIALLDEKDFEDLDENFGVAPSTIRYRKTCAQ